MNRAERRSKRKPAGPAYITIPSTIRYMQHHETALQLVPHTELDRLRDGTADESVWNTLAFRCNWGYIMAGMVDSVEPRPVMLSALRAIVSVQDRHNNTGKWGCTQTEFMQIGDGLNCSDELQRVTTRKEQLDAIRQTMTVSEYKRKIDKIKGMI